MPYLCIWFNSRCCHVCFTNTFYLFNAFKSWLSEKLKKEYIYYLLKAIFLMSMQTFATIMRTIQTKFCINPSKPYYKKHIDSLFQVELIRRHNEFKPCDNGLIHACFYSALNFLWVVQS